MTFSKTVSIAIAICLLPHFAGGLAFAGIVDSVIEQAESGDADKQYWAGRLYEKGRKVDQDLVQALHWYKLAADQNQAKAQFKVGYFYANGLGTERDIEAALEWLEKSANQDYVTAQYHLGMVYSQMPVSDSTISNAQHWLTMARDNKFKAAEYRLLDLQAKKKRHLAARAARAAEKSAKRAPEKPQQKDVVLDAETALTRMLGSAWADEAKKPTPYLPSFITTCEKGDKLIRCLSSSLTRTHGDSDQITYDVESTITVQSISKSTKLAISYRNNVINVEGEDGGEPTLPVKTGWQRTTHTMNCVWDMVQNMVCESERGGTTTFTDSVTERL